jgi:hypothetical protein
MNLPLLIGIGDEGWPYSESGKVGGELLCSTDAGEDTSKRELL